MIEYSKKKEEVFDDKIREEVITVYQIITQMQWDFYKDTVN